MKLASIIGWQLLSAGMTFAALRTGVAAYLFIAIADQIIDLGLCIWWGMQ